MNRAFDRLFKRSRALGNFSHKFLRAVEQHGDRLLTCLEASGSLSRVHLDRAAPSLALDFDQVAAAGRDPGESLSLLGTFYAIQLLHQNAGSLERLALDLAEHRGRDHAYRQFLRRAEDEFSALVSTYTRRTLKILLPPRMRDPWVFCTVGTPGHQDDIDAALIDTGGPAREVLDRTFARLAAQMLRFASVIDNHVAWQLGARGLCISPEEYSEALSSGLLDFVVVTELLRAEMLAGNKPLFHRFRDQVTARYIFRPGTDNLAHEIYLRGILGETRSLLLRPPARGSVNPKNDGLRMILGLTTALRTIQRLDATRPRELLRLLRGRLPGLRATFARLEESLVFLETFRHLAQLLIAQEEEIEVEGGTARANLERVAQAMGYKDRGPLMAVDHLLVHYHEAVETTHSIAQELMEEVARHLASISRFSAWTQSPPPREMASELAFQLTTGSRQLRGVRFWDDLLEALGAKDGRLLDAFCASFARLPEEGRAELARQLADWGRNAPYALLNLLIFLFQRPAIRRETVDPAGEISCAFVERSGLDSEDIRALSRVFRFYPALVNRFLLALDQDKLAMLRTRLDTPIGDPEVAAARDRFRELIDVHRETSRYVQRALARLIVRHPATAQALRDESTLRTLAEGRMAASERHPRLEERKNLLGDFYDLGFLRLALATQGGAPHRQTIAEFNEMTSAYLDSLFDVCLQEAERELGLRMIERDRVGIYLAGGAARGRPYAEDFDLLALIDSDNPEFRRVTEMAVIHMNRQIARRGVIAQYRLGDRLGRFVTGLDDLAEFFSHEQDDLFVDRCQLLGSWQVAGGRRVEDALIARILQPYVFERGEDFFRRIGREIQERRAAFYAAPPGTLHIKEMPGGLREIDLAVIAAEARLGIRQPVAENLFGALERKEPAWGSIFRVLHEASDFLGAVRSAYRVTVAATDLVELDQLASPARILGLAGNGNGKGEAALFETIERQIARAAQAVTGLFGLDPPRIPA